MSLFHRSIFCLLAFVAPFAQAFTPSEPGLYAVFTTSEGEFTAKLHYDKVPLTVANFVGLAEGTNAWFNESDEPQKTRFFDGLIFHRVDDDFVIQGGSPTGTGFGGPGYSIPDEMDSSLFHTKAGVLSMANSGTNTGGSQFFITLASTPHLDGKHSVFGEIVDGMDTIRVIEDVPVNGTTPVNDVTIQTIDIVREGIAAKAFDASAWQISTLRDTPVEFIDNGDTQRFRFDRDENTDYFIYTSRDLDTWTGPTKVSADPNAPDTGEIDLTNAINEDGMGFVQVAARSPQPTLGKDGVRLVSDLGANGILDMTLGGAYTFGSLAGNVSQYLWLPVGNRVQLIVAFTGGLRTMQLYFDPNIDGSQPVFIRLIDTQTLVGDNVTGTITITN